MHCNASSFPWADDVRNPNPFTGCYDLPVTSRLGRSTARQSLFDLGPSGIAVAEILLRMSSFDAAAGHRRAGHNAFLFCSGLVSTWT